MFMPENKQLMAFAKTIQQLTTFINLLLEENAPLKQQLLQLKELSDENLVLKAKLYMLHEMMKGK